MFSRKLVYCLLGSALCFSSLAASAQQQAASQPNSNDPIDQMHVPYGISVNLADAQRVVAAAGAFARKQNWEMSFAVVDTGGQLIYFERIDGTENSSVDMAIGKAQTAALYRRPTKAFEDRLAQGGANLRVLGMKGVVPVSGGVPLVVGGRIVGAIGVSGGSSEEDGGAAQAGAAALK
jgi:uncharacterized protein GlcG (DUF336 family)